MALFTVCPSMPQQAAAQLPSLSDWPSGLEAVGTLYGQSQEGNFDQDLFVDLPTNFPLDASWNQSTLREQFRSGGGATTPWDGAVPPGISLFITGGYYWAVSAPWLKTIKVDQTDDSTTPHVARWRFGMHLYCGPNPPVGCNVTVRVSAKRRAPSGVLLAPIACYSQETTTAVVLAEAHNLAKTGEVVEVQELSNADNLIHAQSYLGDNCTAPFSADALGRQRATDIRLAMQVGGTKPTASPETYMVWGWTVATIKPVPVLPTPIFPVRGKQPAVSTARLPASSVPAQPSSSRDCGSVPCVSIVANSQERCGDYGIVPASDLVNSSTKAVVARVNVTITQGSQRFTRMSVYLLEGSTMLFLGCAGDVTTGQHVNYNLVGEAWR
jgi:hypothetical protein